MEYNLADIFESVVDVVGEREALVCGGRRLTYAELEARSNRWAHHLQSAGVGPGDHVGVQLYNCTEYVETMIACFKIRAVPINVNYRYVEDELAYLFNDADVVALVHDTEFTSRVEAVRARTPKLRHLVTVGTGDRPNGAIDYDDALAAQDSGRSFAPRSADDLYVIYTGGTTGMPKGVMWRQEDLFFAGMGGADPVGTPVSRPEEVAERAATRGALVMFPVAPLMHGAAQLATWIGFLQAAKVVLVRKFDAPDVIETAVREGANSMSIVGDAMARPLAEALEGPFAGTELPALLAVSSAGAILSQTVREKLQGLLPKTLLLDNFGASETGFQGTGTTGSSPDKGLKFTVNARTAVLGEDLKEIEPGSGVVGRMAQRGHVPLGYYKDAEKTAASFVTIDGERWVLLGDMATIEADGTIAILGRGSVCINSGGEKVYPEEVEAVLKGHPAVYDAVVAGVPDERYGQRVAALVQLRPEVDAPDEAALIAHARQHVAGYKAPRLVVVVPEIRRSPSGKADYPWAAKVAAEHAIAVASS
ncbi:MAG: 3-oxocholest-4-en-26-oate---CoA ligase [Frankiaceae bacterium]|nr:3-oxocholest-4-en-26-oate---CoA ligase [Frankiaceae bacterium]